MNIFIPDWHVKLIFSNGCEYFKQLQVQNVKGDQTLINLPAPLFSKGVLSQRGATSVGGNISNGYDNTLMFFLHSFQTGHELVGDLSHAANSTIWEDQGILSAWTPAFGDRE